MAWTNIFDLCDWDVYVQYASVSGASPDSNNFLVHMDDFDPSIGTISIVGGEIVMDMAVNPTSGGGPVPYVVAVPKSAHPGGMVRMTYTEGRGQLYVNGFNGGQSNGVSLDSPNEWVENAPPMPNPVGGLTDSWVGNVATITSNGELDSGAAITFVCLQKGF